LTLDATRIVAVRHGQTDWNAGQRIQGHTDIPLNDAGRLQARQLAAALVDERFDAVYASDLARAQQTADALTPLSGTAVLTDVGLRERCFGDFEGLSHGQVEAAWPEQSRRWRRRDPHYAPPGGESLWVFYARCIGAAERLALRHAGQSIAIVAHGGVLDCLYRAATHLPLEAPRSWQLGNASINRLLHAGEGFTLIGWNDDAHLLAAPPQVLQAAPGPE